MVGGNKAVFFQKSQEWERFSTLYARRIKRACDLSKKTTFPYGQTSAPIAFKREVGLRILV